MVISASAWPGPVGPKQACQLLNNTNKLTATSSDQLLPPATAAAAAATAAVVKMRWALLTINLLTLLETGANLSNANGLMVHASR